MQEIFSLAKWEVRGCTPEVIQDIQIVNVFCIQIAKINVWHFTQVTQKYQLHEASSYLLEKKDDIPGAFLIMLEV